MHPVPEKDSPIEKKRVDEISTEMLGLPDGFEWCTMKIDELEDCTVVFKLLREHYVEDTEGIFRFDYPVDFLQWILLVPGHISDWHVGIRSTKNKKLFGFIAGTPVKVNVN